MAAYRIYIIDPDGRLRLGDGFDAPDDAAALARFAEFHHRGLTLELWQGGRLVLKRSRDEA